MSDLCAKMRTSTTNRKEMQMETAIQTPTVGSQFTTQKSAVTGTVTEVKENKNGTLRIKLDVNGQERWTTVKQFQLWGLAKMSDPYAKIILITTYQ